MEDVSSEAADSPKLTNPHPRAPPTNDPTHPPTTSLSQQALLALETNSPLTRILTPLSLTPLSTLTTLRHPRTTITSHLAIISWISTHTIKRPNMALKRDLRLVDPSTPKAVLLSVFVDALTFTPAVGTVALFRNLRAHEWEGGSLNAYAKDCKGLEWFVPNPVRDVGEGVVRRLGEWWVRRLEGDRVLRRERARVEEGVGGLEGGGCLS